MLIMRAPLIIENPLSLGMSYKLYHVIVTRTLLINPTPEQKKAYLYGNILIAG